jgi:sodium pump decarboxylase gamma subunit
MLETVLLNTAMGMGVVFLVLIFISLVIYLLGVIPKIVERSARKKSEKSNQSQQSEAPVVSQSVAAKAPVVPSKNNDTELIAVIAAAIAAAMSDELGQPVTADGLVIRSIKRRR